MPRILVWNQSINWDKVAEIKKNAIDWNKVNELLRGSLSDKNIEKIKNCTDVALKKQFVELAEWVKDHSTSRYVIQNALNKYYGRATDATRVSKNAWWAWWVWWILGIGVIIGIIMYFANYNETSGNSSHSNHSATSYNDSRSDYSSNSNSLPHSNSSSTDNSNYSHLKPTYKESEYKGNQLSNGNSPFDACFGKGIYSGNATLTIKNGSSSDAIVCLYSVSRGRTIRNEYVRKNSSFTMDNIAQGYYKIRVFYGNDWNPTLENSCNTKGNFESDVSFSEFDGQEYFEDSYDGYTVATVTLYTVAGGNASTSKISQSDFFGN
jgi:hypothetical protein